MSSEMSSQQAQPNQPGPPTSISHQITLLQQRGMAVPDPAGAERFLSNVNFYRFRGYLEPFVAPAAVNSPPHTFLPGTSLDQAVERYEFDTQLRALLIGGFNRIEVSIRTQWTYHLTYTQGGGPFSHQNASLFSKGHAKNWHDLSREYIRHGQANHSYPLSGCPTWAIVETMTFGLLSRWYGDTNKQVRQLVAKHYLLDESVLQSLLRHLTPVRNFCAHHERLWDRDLKTRMKVPKNMGTFAKPTSFFNLNQRGKLYNTLVMIAYLTATITRTNDWALGFRTLMNQHQHIPQSQMGFPANWQQLAIWQ